MICVIDESNRIINIVDSPYPVENNERQWHPWNSLWDTYTDVEPAEYTNQREAANMKSKLQQKALDSMMLILNGSSEVSALQKEYQAKLDSVTNDVALHMVDMFPVWNPNGVTYKKGKRISYNGVLYEVVKEHVSQENWKPDVTPSEYAKVISSISGEIPEWEQPLPTNAYKLGDRVKHNGRYYESTYDGANVWEPGVVGEEYWKDITDEIGEAS
nr:MAG TPA: ChiA1-BD-binding domain protein [Caudoviricetes sp.]